MSQYVFICHATEDKAVATAICETLEAGGVPCWIAPRNIKPGADYGGAIIKAIGEAKALVLVLSAHSNESEHVKREVERAVSHGVSVIPFRIEEILPSEALEYFISTTQWVDAFTSPLEKHLVYLVENLRELVPPEAKELKVAEPEPPPPPRAAAPPAKSWFLTVPGLVTLAGAGVLVVAGLLGGLYLAGTFSRPGKPGPPEAPPVAVAPPVQSEPTTSAPGVAEGPRWPFTSEREVNENDVRSLSPNELDLMRNEIYARHGWVFARPDLANYFSSKPWYKPKGTLANREEANRRANAEMTNLEKRNAEIIRQYERR